MLNAALAEKEQLAGEVRRAEEAAARERSTRVAVEAELARVLSELGQAVQAQQVGLAGSGLPCTHRLS
jgi:hypothetical protein